VAPRDVSAGGAVASRLEDATTTGRGPGLVRQPRRGAQALVIGLETLAIDDEQARRLRLLLLGKGAVSGTGWSVRSLLRWTTRSSTAPTLDTAAPRALGTNG
jgi:hypothetical protein